MVKWEVLARPREFGDFGFIDIGAIYKLDSVVENMAMNKLRKKCLNARRFYQYDKREGKQFW